MKIIKFTKNTPYSEYAMLNLYPDQFVSQKEKESNDWIKTNMDYFYTVALQQYQYKKQYIRANYELVKGKITRKDFYKDTPIDTFFDTILKDDELPPHVKHYSILTPPINTLVGEFSQRPDNIIVKAFDDDSKSEELQMKTHILQQLVISLAREHISQELAMKGVELESQDEFEQMTYDKALENLTSFTTQAEKWGSKQLDYLKMAFNIKDKSEEAFRDLIICAEQYYHIYEDNSKIGFNVETLNPENYWELTTKDKKYSSDPLDASAGSYASGTIYVMELSEIINKFSLSKEIIDHLKDQSQQAYLINQKDSTLTNPRGRFGPNTVQYNTYDRAVYEERMFAEGSIQDGYDDLNNLLGITSNVGVYGNKYVVVQSYWASKHKIGKLTILDDVGDIQVILVDENYKKGSHPGEIDLEWGWINRWWQGLKIGHDVYDAKPLQILDYNPIIGSRFESKNVKGRPVSLVDQMKPFQMLYNIAMNQLFQLLEKDMGVVFLTSIRHVPRPKDGDSQDALDVWEEEARNRGVVFVDDSPENLKAPSGFNQHTAVNLSRAQEIQARYQLAVEMRNECWKLVGLSEQRVGESKASETATGINTALTQSFAQTEPLFMQQEYTLNKLYQGILDAALYIESNKPTSTLNYMSDEGERVFLQINGSDLKLKDLGVFVTSRSEDLQRFQEFKSLAQAMMQNGATPYELSVLYSTKSMRKMQKIFKDLKDKQEAFAEQQQAMERQQIEQQQAQFEQAQQLAQLQDEKNKIFEAQQNELDRISRERVAYIAASSKNDTLGSEPSALDLSKFDNELRKTQQDYSSRIQDISIKQQQILSQNQQSLRQEQLKRDEMQNKLDLKEIDYKIAKENKSKYDSKK